MIALNNENTTSQPNLETEKLETNLVQEKVESQEKPIENKEEEKQEDPNWRAFREARKKDRAEKEAAQRLAAEREAEANALRAAMEAAFAKQAPAAPQQTYNGFGYEPEESEDERIEKKVQAAIAKREAEAERIRIQREHEEYPHRLTKNYPDFNQVINQETLDYLDYHYPEVSRPLQRLHDGYDKWEDIYKAVRKFVPNHSTSKKDAMRADVNLNKPKSMSAPGLSQSQDTLNAKLTEDRKMANWERMRKTLNSLG